MLALPGAVAVVIGLRRTAASLEAIARPPVGGALRLTAVAFAVYALLEGCISMPAPFLPGIRPQRAGRCWTGRHPHRGLPLAHRPGHGGRASSAASTCSSRRPIARLAEARRRELLARERDRIGRDLHDGIIQSIYAAGLHLEEARVHERRPASRHRAGAWRAGPRHRRHPAHDLRPAQLLARRARPGAAGRGRGRRAARPWPGWRSRRSVEGELAARARPTSRPTSCGIIVREALSNVLRHAGASPRRAAPRLLGQTSLLLEIRDDGRGLRPAALVARRAGGLARRASPTCAAVPSSSARRSRSAAPRAAAPTLSLTMPVAAVRREP